MPDKSIDKLTEIIKPGDILMQADIIDQLNTNSQSNMTLSAYSLITQSVSTVKISNSDRIESET